MNTKKELAKVFADTTNITEMSALLSELHTPSELSDLTLRWQLLKQLNQGITQREIAKKFGISLCKITRGSKILKEKNSIVKKILAERTK